MLEKLWRDWPDELRFANLLMICCRSLQQSEDMAHVVEDLLAARKRLCTEAREKIKLTQETIKQRLIIMRREIDEVIRSQRTMLDRLGKQGAKLDEAQLAATFTRQLTEVDRWLVQRKIPRLVMHYRDAIDRPTEIAEQLAVFLGIDLDTESMANAVDRQLYRQRQSGDAS